ncbi:8-oxo-dGDP phosphatase NUDT18 [Chrysoperla carnea]|uniref:8-oxo-dGDP phosphatase NUDT18 n=1 Tax=Chrysoperla carnea TaxID=189513 RepID=UPI001D05DB06|nr:8-oxo-dGDP phosphatase NUDT18 [Chrysoperla carnea]
MTDSIQNTLTRILGGLPPESTAELCDFTIAQQNEVMESQGVTPNVKSDYIPILGESVTYIVASVIINELNEVLMVQEAKASCAGKWYLPAGRMKPNESIIDGAKREVEEETGLTVDLTSLITVETVQGTWIRFVFSGYVTGGVLKTPDKADEESLQAKWVKSVDSLQLRASDIINLVERARFYKEAQKRSDPTWHPDLLPAVQSHKRILLRVVICARKRATNRLNFVISELESMHLPTCEIYPTRSVHVSLKKFMVNLFGAEVPQHRPHGLLNVEHNGIEGNFDGFCLTLLVAFRPPVEDVPIVANKCIWQEINSKHLEESLLRKISNKNETIPLNVIR